ncbi:hypothetical protein BD309DRAFT_1016853 [Dichomitus squalens]|uniref:Uncharacterized protein n=1 Tax=Dichomitus squalens TaxID=114155 RepID=A0A4V6MWV0_9APHY|nr:hypothetical protein BD309DRAFT_1016853 [Dichomitus squalens]TBU60498.1 hypothetical protein BD310DRAFT_905261 [Dichomitus squalens]
MSYKDKPPSKPKRESRRPFGRPKEAPGPVQTFEDSFQIPPAAGPHPGGSHQGVFQLSQDGQFTSLPAATRPRRSPGRGQGAGAGRVTRTRQADDVPTEAGPSKRRRPSIAAPAGSGGPGHRQTRSTPEVPVIAHPGESHFHRSNSSSVLPRMYADDSGSLAGPRSWPRTVGHFPTAGPQSSQVRTNALSPMSPIPSVAFSGGDRLTPDTPGSGAQYSPQGLSSSNWADTPSTGSLPLTPSRQHDTRTGPYGLPDPSSVYGEYWQYPSSAPHSPSSLRAPSHPPSSATPSPFIGMVGDFDFDSSPTYGPSGEHPASLLGSRAVSDHQRLQDPSDLPPLPPDQFPLDMMFSGNTVYPQPTAMTAIRHPQGSHYGQQVSYASMSGTPRPPHPLMNRHGLPAAATAPDLSQTQHLFFPEGIFGETTEPVLAYSDAQQEAYAPPASGYMHASHSAPGPSGSGYYPAPVAHAYPSQAGLSYFLPAGHPYSSEGGPLYVSQAEPAYPSPERALYSSHLRPPHSSQAGRHPRH